MVESDQIGQVQQGDASMTQQKRPLFRDHALQHYIQKREIDVLPQIVSPPIFLFIWLVLALLLLAGLLAWLSRVPTYAYGNGVVSTSDQRIDVQHNRFDALVFVPATESGQWHQGLASTVQIGSSGQSFNSIVMQKDPVVYSPQQAQSHYNLSCNVAQALTGPTVALHMRVMVPAGAHVQSGTSLHAQAQVGSQRVLTLFPVFDQLLKGG
jgi:hypothetical protein